MRVRCEISGVSAEAGVGLDLKGLKSLDRKFADVTGVKPAASAPGEIGIGAKYVLRKGNGDVEAGFSVLRAIQAAQRADEDCNGFLRVSRNPVEITPSQFFDGVEGDVLVCPNERSKERMSRALEGEQGNWVGLHFNFDCGEVDVEDPLKEFELVFQKWLVSAWIEGDVEERAEEVAAFVCSDSMKAFYDLLNEPVSSWSVAERNLLFWQKKDTEISAKKMKSVVGVLFRATNEYVPFDELVKEAATRLDSWASQAQRREWGIMDDSAFIVAQMIKSRAQFLVRKKHGTVMYVPKPEQYLRNLKGN